MDTQTKLTVVQQLLLRLVANQPEDHAISWGDLHAAREACGDVPDDVLQPLLTWLEVNHPLLPPEKQTRWASSGEYQREVMEDADGIVRDLPRDKVTAYLRALDPEDHEKEVDWSEFDDELDTRLDDTADQMVTYTAVQYELLFWSRNEDAIEELGEDLGSDTSKAISRMAFCAYRQDLVNETDITNSELARRHGFELCVDENGDTILVG